MQDFCIVILAHQLYYTMMYTKYLHLLLCIISLHPITIITMVHFSLKLYITLISLLMDTAWTLLI